MATDPSTSPLIEARGFLPLLMQESREAIEAQILGGWSPDSYRRRTALLFDSLCLRVSIPALRRGRVRLLDRANGKHRPSAFLEREILQRLRANQSIDAVARGLRIPYSAVRRISAKCGNAFCKIGRGRKVSAAKIQEVVDQLRAGARPCDLMREHCVAAEFIRKLRRKFLGDYQDRRHLKKLTPADIARGEEALRQGKTWQDAARVAGCSFSAFYGATAYRKGPRRISDAERGEIEDAIRSGASLDALCQQFHHHYGVFQRIRREMGVIPRMARVFTPTERDRILALIAAGKTDGQVALEMQSTGPTIWMIRKRATEGTSWKTAVKA